VISGVLVQFYLPGVWSNIVCFLSIIGGIIIFISLMVSFYVYDLSALYQFQYLEEINIGPKIINIHAGFDETSAIIQDKFPDAELSVLDFYDPLQHTEISIKRARKAYPPYPSTLKTSTTKLPFERHSTDTIFLVFAAHEIREDAERILFFSELCRIIKPGGKIIVTEHLRDLPNFLAYNIGFFHFLSEQTWNNTFKKSGLTMFKETKNNVFIRTFILTTHDITS